jgi:predicted nucleotidyltransferase
MPLRSPILRRLSLNGVADESALSRYIAFMNKQEVIAKLREYEAELRARGVRHTALFGSVARGSATAESDIDIMLDLDLDVVGDVYDYVA